jgi:hypothetical protein
MKKAVALTLFLLMGLCAFAQSEETTEIETLPITEMEEIAEEPSTPELSEEEERLIRIFNGERDEYDVPTQLYTIDDHLKIKLTKYERESQNAGTMGVTSLILTGLGAVLAVATPDLVWAPSGNATGIPYGYFLMAVGGGVGLYTLFVPLPNSSRYKSDFQDYYSTTYSEYIK